MNALFTLASLVSLRAALRLRPAHPLQMIESLSESG